MSEINYAYLQGFLEQTIRGLSYYLVKEGFVSKDRENELENFLNEKIEIANRAEREYSGGNNLSY